VSDIADKRAPKSLRLFVAINLFTFDGDWVFGELGQVIAIRFHRRKAAGTSIDVILLASMSVSMACFG
jgi:hypothetical protein